MKQLAAIACIAFAFCLSLNAQSSVVRLQSVPIPFDSGLMTDLLADFEKTTGYHVQVNTSDSPYTFARQGAADLVLSHYGHDQVDDFMADGLGLWPRMAFASQSVLIGSPTDPAGITSTQDAVDAFRRIAATKSRFVLNNADAEKYLEQLLYEGAGEPDRTGWYVDNGASGQQAIQAAQQSNGYTTWGLIPFLKFKAMTNSPVQAFVFDDPLLQRAMMTVIVNPDKIAGVNVAGALALQRYLSLPSTQMRIRAFRSAGIDRQVFWPAAYDNTKSYVVDQSSLPTAVGPSANSVTITPAVVRTGDSFTASITGANLAADTYFDVQFRRPGAISDEIALNWQQGVSVSHPVLAAIATGTWRITGIRAHSDANDHGGSVIPITGAVTVGP
jgi:tungstate transport system substrate-binding protein